MTTRVTVSRVAALCGLGMGVLAVWSVFVQKSDIRGWHMLFAPGFIGYALVGGVHGEAPGWLQGVAWGITTAIAWWVIFMIIFYLTALGARRLRTR